MHDRHDRRDLRGQRPLQSPGQGLRAVAPALRAPRRQRRGYVRAGDVRGQRDHAGERGRRTRLPGARRRQPLVLGPQRSRPDRRRHAHAARAARPRRGDRTRSRRSRPATCTPARSPPAPPCSAGAPATAASSATLGGNDRGLPQLVAGVDRADRRAAIALAAGRDFSCALRRRPRRALLGRRQPRSAGRRRRAAARTCRAVVPGLSANVAKLSAQWQHACALRRRPARWPAGARTPAARSATASRAARVRRPRRPPPLPAQVTAVAAGRDHTCALRAPTASTAGARTRRGRSTRSSRACRSRRPRR